MKILSLFSSFEGKKKEGKKLNCLLRGLNSGSSDYETDTLPTALRRLAVSSFLGVHLSADAQTDIISIFLQRLKTSRTLESSSFFYCLQSTFQWWLKLLFKIKVVFITYVQFSSVEVQCTKGKLTSVFMWPFSYIKLLLLQDPRKDWDHSGNIFGSGWVAKCLLSWYLVLLNCKEYRSILFPYRETNDSILLKTSI